LKRKIHLYIADILAAMNNAEKFIGTMSYEGFFLDEKTTYAVIRCIEIIGEATKNITDDIRQKYMDVPWRDMAGMRDKVSHSYFGVDYEKVWLVVKKDIPHLKPLLQQILTEVQRDELHEDKT